MLKSFLVLLAVLGVCAAFAEERPTFVPTPAPEPAPEAKSPSVLQRLFGSRQTKRTLFPTTPAPKPEAEPPAAKVAKPTPSPEAKMEAPPKKPGTGKVAATGSSTRTKRKPKAKVASREEEPAPARTAKSETAEAVKPAPENPPATPAAGKKTRKGKAGAMAKAVEGAEPPADADPETKEQFRFDQARAKAAEDPEVKELKAKADGAATDDEARSAQRAYNKALFGKMRKLDETLDERITQMETAVLKRLESK